MHNKITVIFIAAYIVPIIVALTFLVIDLHYANGALHTPDWANFFVGLLTYYGTISLGGLAYYQNEKIRNLEAERHKAEVSPIIGLKQIVIEYVPWEPLAVIDIDKTNPTQTINKSIDLSHSVPYIGFRLKIENESNNQVKALSCYETLVPLAIEERKNNAENQVIVSEMTAGETQEIVYYFVFDEIDFSGGIKVSQLNSRIYYEDIFGNNYCNDISIHVRYIESQSRIYTRIFFSKRMETNKEKMTPIYYHISNYMKSTEGIHNRD